MLRRFSSYVPVCVLSLALRLLAVLLVLSLTRVVFYFKNREAFSSVGASDWLIGCWFDCVTVALIFLPFIFLSLLPIRFENNNWYRWTKKACFYIPFLLVVALNLMDTEYFDFTRKRSTADLFAIVSAGNDVRQLIGSFIRDFWVMILLFVIFILFIEVFYRKTEFEALEKKGYSSSKKKEWVFFILLLPLCILIGRGGFVLKPLNIIDATLYTEPQNTAFVLNSAFTMIKSYGKDDLEEKKFFADINKQHYFSPIRISQPQNRLPEKTNVVVIMLESFGNEWVGAFNGSKTFSPFLDSLIEHSWTFDYGFSNGKKSIEAVPAIMASMPSLMDNPYISSPYAGNALTTLPNILKKHGYSTAFFHGATNGSMRFNSFAKHAGFDRYFGRSEYGNDAHSDKTWGILDEYFNPWTAHKLSELKTPFFGTLFTLSSHHPYFVPEHWKEKLKTGFFPICQSIHYADESLKRFFEEAKKEPWYSNTLFVLVADHTPSTESNFYGERTQMYRIPIVFFHPQKNLLPTRREPVIFQQADIMPTVLDLLNVQTQYYSIGNSYFSNNPRECLTYLEGTYYYFREDYLLVFSNDKLHQFIQFKSKKHTDYQFVSTDSLVAKKFEKRLKAIIQRYNHDLIHNQTRVE